MTENISLTIITTWNQQQEKILKECIVKISFGKFQNLQKTENGLRGCERQLTVSLSPF